LSSPSDSGVALQPVSSPSPYGEGWREASSFEKPIFFVQDKIRILHDVNVLIGNYFGALKINL